jgi:hypothetical protein
MKNLTTNSKTKLITLAKVVVLLEYRIDPDQCACCDIQKGDPWTHDVNNMICPWTIIMGVYQDVLRETYIKH